MEAEIKKVAITGASSGLGEALVRDFASRGADVALLARRQDRLQTLADELTECYPQQRFVAEKLDVAETDAVLPALERVRDALGGLDTVIANAGVTTVNPAGKGDFDKDRKLTEINLLGGMATCDAAARLFREQGYGRIAGTASIAAYVGIPGSASYSASKAAFGRYLETIRMELHKKHVIVTAIYPGFVKTDLAPGMEKMPFVISAEKAAKQIVTAIEAGKGKVIVPNWPWRFAMPALKLVPEKVLLSMFK